MKKMIKYCREVELEMCDKRSCKCNDCSRLNLSGEDCMLCPKYGCPEHLVEIEVVAE